MSEAKTEATKTVVQASREFLLGRDTISPPMQFSKQVGDVLFAGEFRFQRPDWKTTLSIEVYKGEISSKWNDQLQVNESMPISPNANLFAQAIATLHFVIAKAADGTLCAPDWFDLDLLKGSEGDEIVVAVYLMYFEWERQFFRPVAAKPQGGA